MTSNMAQTIPCAVCGGAIQRQDIVIVSHEMPPPWVPAEEQLTTTFVHQKCELDGGRADYNWTREAPQTLSHALAMLERRRGRAG